MCHQNYSLPCTKIIGFVACRVTSKVIVIGSAENYWGGTNTIKSGKYMLSLVMYQINRVLFIHMPLLNNLSFNSIILKKFNDHYSSHN